MNTTSEARVMTSEERLKYGCGDFGDAIAALKAGFRVQRSGWNGKGMWLALTEGSEIPVSSAPERAAPAGFTGAAAHRVAEIRGPATTQVPDPRISICPHIDMRAADGSLVIGWLASQTDMLATDWRVVP